MQRGQQQPLRGRQLELTALEELVAGAAASRSAAVVLRGPAGVGKTALLDELARRVAGDALVLRATGTQGESTVSWSALADVCRPLLDDLDRLPGPQRDALAGALAVGPPAAGDRFTIGTATLGLLALAAERAPVLVLVDDLAWLDVDSSEALLFAVRRLRTEGVAVVATVRDGHEVDLGGFESLTVEPLAADDAGAVLRAASPGPIDDAVASALLLAAAGTPLALVQLPQLLTPGQREGRERLPDPLPTPPEFEAAIGRQLEHLGPGEATALTVAAAHGAGPVGPVTRALDQLGVDTGALAAVERQGLIDLTSGRLRFSHPLIRSAAYHRARPDDVRAAHRALAAALDGPGDLDAKARHAAAAATGPDERVASLLARAAAAARSRGALGAAAELLDLAAGLSPDTDTRLDHLIAAADLNLLTGRTTRAGELLDVATAPTDRPLALAELAAVRSRWLIVVGRSRVALDELVHTADAVETAAPTEAARLLVHAAAVAVAGADPEGAIKHAQRALELVDDTSQVGSLARLAFDAARVVAGEEVDPSDLLERVRVIGATDDLLHLAQPLVLAAASALIWLEDFDAAEALTDTVIDTARRANAVGPLPLALTTKAWALGRQSRPAIARAHASEAIELAEACGQRTLTTRNTLAFINSLAGRREEAEAEAAHVRATLGPGRMTPMRYNATFTMARSALAGRRLAEAVELYEQIVLPSASTPFFANPAAFGATFDLIDAYVRAGSRSKADDLLQQVVPHVGSKRWPLGQVARLEGMLATDGYGAHFERAVELFQPTPIDQVRTHLCWAERLRADGCDAEALAQLRAGYAIARRHGCHLWTGWLTEELAGLGQPVLASGEVLARLSGEELAVATAVAEGATVAGAAAALFLSPQAVEDLLDRACRVLGVADAAGLAARLAPAPASALHRGWRLDQLGGARLFEGDTERPVPSGRAGALLHIVALAGRPVLVDEAVEVLWPEAAPGAGRTRLRNVLTRLRQTVGADLVTRQGDTLVLAPDVAVDSDVFAAGARAALDRAATDAAEAIALARAALETYRGSLLPEHPYEPWAVGPRERLAHRHLALLDLLAADAETRGVLDDAVRYVELTIEAEPYAEERYVEAARLRLRQGRRRAALDLCRRARAVAAELDVPPSPALEEVEAAARG